MELNQVTLPCTDYEESVRFYREMGFRQIVANPPNYARFECESGATFSLQRVESVDVPSDIVIFFEVEDVDSVVQELLTAGIVFESKPTDQGWLWREANLRDPAGNMLCIYHAGENRRFPASRLKEGAV